MIKLWHPTKTGGTSLSEFLGLTTTHCPLDFRTLKNKKELDVYIACVRNPYDRVVSMYGFFEIGDRISIDLFLDKLEGFSKKMPLYFPQHRYTHLNGVKSVDHIIKLESIDVDTSNFLGRDVIVIHSNKDKRRQIELSDSQKEIVFRVYEDDFKLLNYKK